MKFEIVRLTNFQEEKQVYIYSIWIEDDSKILEGNMIFED